MRSAYISGTMRGKTTKLLGSMPYYCTKIKNALEFEDTRFHPSKLI